MLVEDERGQDSKNNDDDRQRASQQPPVADAINTHKQSLSLSLSLIFGGQHQPHIQGIHALISSKVSIYERQNSAHLAVVTSRSRVTRSHQPRGSSRPAA